ncbi:MAG: right-handed parallel beta-helix repeat-containing protein [Opitutales bacterium]
MTYFRHSPLTLLFLCCSSLLPLNCHADYEAWLIELEDVLAAENIVDAERLLKEIPPAVRTDPSALLDSVRPHRLVYLEAYYGSLGGKKPPIRALVEPLLDRIVGSSTPKDGLRKAAYHAGPNSAIGVEAGNYGRIGVQDQALVSLGSPGEVMFERITTSGRALIAGISINPQPSKFPVVACSVGRGQAVLVGCTIQSRDGKATGFSTRKGSPRIAHCVTINCSPGFISWSRSGMLVRDSSAKSGGGRGFVSAFRGIMVAEKCHAEGNLNSGFNSIGDSEMKLKQCVALKNKGYGYVASSRSRMVVEDSFAPQNGRHGFSSVGYAQMILDRCTAEKNGENGFTALGFASLVATDCRAASNAGSGFGSYIAAEMVLFKCKANFNEEAGYKADKSRASNHAYAAILIRTSDCEVVMQDMDRAFVGDIMQR